MSVNSDALGYVVSFFIVAQLSSYVFVQRYPDLKPPHGSSGSSGEGERARGDTGTGLDDAHDVDDDAEMLVLAGGGETVSES